jgi:DNA-binding MarR family transcriptional regulator
MPVKFDSVAAPARGGREPLEMLDAYLQWFSVRTDDRPAAFRGYVQDLAHTRYLTRKVFRIVDEQARMAGVEPLQYQALVQVYGAASDVVHVNEIAERLDVAAAFASRLIKELQAKGLVERTRSTVDKRMTRVGVTGDGVELIRRVDAAVHVHLDYFQKQVPEGDRLAALTTLAFCVGLPAECAVARTLKSETGRRALGG